MKTTNRLSGVIHNLTACVIFISITYGFFILSLYLNKWALGIHDIEQRVDKLENRSQ